AARQESLPLAGPNTVAKAPGVRHRPAHGGDALEATDTRTVSERRRVRGANVWRRGGRAAVFWKVRRVALGSRSRDARRGDCFPAGLRPGAPSGARRAKGGSDFEAHAPGARERRRTSLRASRRDRSLGYADGNFPLLSASPIWPRRASLLSFLPVLTKGR